MAPEDKLKDKKCNFSDEKVHLSTLPTHTHTQNHHNPVALIPIQLFPWQPDLKIVEKAPNISQRVNSHLLHRDDPTRCPFLSLLCLPETKLTCDLEDFAQRLNCKIHQVCQKKKASLFCGSRVIRVLMANYGRTSTKVCEHGAPRRQPPSTSCRLAEALQLVADRCDGKHKCSIRASNLVFSNPCPGTTKYLEYSYTCVHPGS
ncbi:uncharacterized protein [Brachyistius frenatus]|uniref:uncharacterized protein n=1 Tax=Brachyistius frenatus TaxID=100188 RepID=UPI0037E982DD